MSSLDKIKNDALAKTGRAPEAVPSVAPEVKAAEVVEEEYQVYKSSLTNQRIVMPNGKCLRITSNKYITKDAAEIEFLDKEISLGFPYMSKSTPIMTSDLDPMSALRKKFFAEFEAAQGKVPSSAPSSSDQATITPASTAALAALAAGSISQG